MKEPEDFRSPDHELKLRDLLAYRDDVAVLRRDGHYCTQCLKRIPKGDLVGPINVVIRDPGTIGPEGMTREFCSWECASDWFEIQAGRRACDDSRF